MLNSFKFYLTSLLMLAPQLLWANSIISNCLDNFLVLKSDTVYLRPGLPIKMMQDPRRNMSVVSIGGACKLLGATEVLLQLDNSKVVWFEFSLAPSSGVIFTQLDPSIQMSISTQLAQGLTVPVMVPLTLFKDDRRRLVYGVLYKNKMFYETISGGQFSSGVGNEN